MIPSPSNPFSLDTLGNQKPLENSQKQPHKVAISTFVDSEQNSQELQEGAWLEMLYTCRATASTDAVAEETAARITNNRGPQKKNHVAKRIMEL